MRLKGMPLEGEYKECIENESNKEWLKEKNLLPRTYKSDDPYFLYRNKLAYEFYKEKIEELRKTINNMTIPSNVLNIINTIYQDKVFLYNINPEILEKFIDTNNAIEYNEENDKEYSLKEKVEMLNNHSISEIYNKIMSENKNIHQLDMIYPPVFSDPYIEPDYNLTSYFHSIGINKQKKMNLQEFSFDEFNVFNEIDGMVNLSMGHYNNLKFMCDLINRYNLNEAQCSILLLNLDLLYTMFIEYSINSEYNNILGMDNTDKLMNNFKSLTSKIKLEDMTAYSLSTLLNNRVFFIDIEKILTNFPNITGDDILRLTMCKKDIKEDELYRYLDLLNTCDDEIKELIFENISSLFSSTYTFPDVTLDKFKMVTYEDCSFSRLHFESTDIIEKNFMFFEAYDKYFENSLDLDELQELVTKDNCKDILLAMLLFKNSLKYNIPKYEDTRYSEEINDVETHIESVELYHEEFGHKYYDGEGYNVYLTEKLNRYVTSGNLEFGEKDIENQKNIFELIKKLAKQNGVFKLDDFLDVLLRYPIDMSIYAYIKTMINEYNKYQEKAKEKVKE